MGIFAVFFSGVRCTPVKRVAAETLMSCNGFMVSLADFASEIAVEGRCCKRC